MTILPRMDPQDPSDQLQARLEKLEAEVAWLLARERARGAAPADAPTPARPQMPVVATPQGLPVQPTPPPSPALPPPPAKPRKERNPVVLVAALGAGIFLLGAIFFLMYAIQQGWIGPELRFLLGLLVGGGLTAFAAKLVLGDGRRIGSAILAAGLGTLEFTFYVGAFTYHFFPPALGLAAVAAAALVAGGLAARAESEAPFAVAFLTAFVAPFVFSTGGHHEVALSVYLLALAGAATALPYLARTGARWGLSRWLVAVLVWSALAGVAFAHLREDAATLSFLLIAHYALAFAWVWLPGQSEARPSTPTLLWFALSVAATSLGAAYWRSLGLLAEGFAVPVVLIAGLNLAAVKPMRARLGSRQADLGLLVLAAGHLALAVPIALAWRWVGPLWGAFALGLAWAAGKAETLPDWDGEEAAALRKLALGMVLLATLRWLVQGSSGSWERAVSVWYGPAPVLRPPFFNGLFALGVLASGAWTLLARRGKAYGVLGFLGLELVGNLTLAFELAHLVRWAGGTPHSAGVAFTLVWALSGALQWLKSLSIRDQGLRRGLTAAGYTWLGLASFKLIVVDMADAGVALRALAFLAVGAIFMVAALLGHKLKPTEEA
ncbi:MAG TPA: DUF2339 domain-containing protein [Holophagaceae bacterium]|nr:DUF2339 domain-containing protein [Holophagaceae bacterium]